MSNRDIFGSRGLILNEDLIFERSDHCTQGIKLPKQKSVESKIPESMKRTAIGLPEVSEVDVVRHYTRLSTWNYGVDSGFYPLGSCTMKYNPKINEEMCNLPGFANLNPYQPVETVQGALEALYTLQETLAELTGLPGVTVVPSAGAHGEYTGIKIMKAFHESKGEQRKKVLIPDTAHGTNPATCTLNGFDVVKIPITQEGILSLEDVEKHMDSNTVGLMITNPNTLGLFEKNLPQIAEMIHSRGGLVYCDGANFNALMGYCKPSTMGVDVMHLNLHKTFSTPHGGGGPGSGPVCVTAELTKFLPLPKIVKEENNYRVILSDNDSIGFIRSGFGNFGVNIRALTYVLSMGTEGLKRATELAVLNANFIRKELEGLYELPFGKTCMHECVFSDKIQQAYGVKNIDIAKRLIDFGFHPPTMSFPLVVHGALMIEPTETEGMYEINKFIEAMKRIAEESKTAPELLLQAPHNTRTTRVNEAQAARNPVLCDCMS